MKIFKYLEPSTITSKPVMSKPCQYSYRDTQNRKYLWTLRHGLNHFMHLFLTFSDLNVPVPASAFLTFSYKNYHTLFCWKKAKSAIYRSYPTVFKKTSILTTSKVQFYDVYLNAPEQIDSILWMTINVKYIQTLQDYNWKRSILLLIFAQQKYYYLVYHAYLSTFLLFSFTLNQSTLHLC